MYHLLLPCPRLTLTPFRQSFFLLSTPFVFPPLLNLPAANGDTTGKLTKFLWIHTTGENRIRTVYLKLDQPVQELPAIGSQICLSSDCHCMLLSVPIYETFFCSGSRKMADDSCTDCFMVQSRQTGRIYDFRRYLLVTQVRFLIAGVHGPGLVSWLSSLWSDCHQ